MFQLELLHEVSLFSCRVVTIYFFFCSCHLRFIASTLTIGWCISLLLLHSRKRKETVGSSAGRMHEVKLWLRIGHFSISLVKHAMASFSFTPDKKSSEVIHYSYSKLWRPIIAIMVCCWVNVHLRVLLTPVLNAEMIYSLEVWKQHI